MEPSACDVCKRPQPDQITIDSQLQCSIPTFVRTNWTSRRSKAFQQTLKCGITAFLHARASSHPARGVNVKNERGKQTSGQISRIWQWSVYFVFCSLRRKKKNLYKVTVQHQTQTVFKLSPTTCCRSLTMERTPCNKVRWQLRRRGGRGGCGGGREEGRSCSSCFWASAGRRDAGRNWACAEWVLH